MQKPFREVSMSAPQVDWDKYAEQYDALTTNGSNPAYLELIGLVKEYFQKEVVINKGSLVVDMGGGTGNFSLPLAESYPDSKFIVIDTSERMLKIAEEKAAKKGVKNLLCMVMDVEDVRKIRDIYSQPVNHVIMIHCLYATREGNSDKPRRILKNICDVLKDHDSRLFISDINRPLRTGNWIPYCLWNAFKSYGEVGNGVFKRLEKTIQFFKENDQAKLANRHIDAKQREGEYLLCDLEKFVIMIKDAGFRKIYRKADNYYRGRDNLVIAGK